MYIMDQKRPIRKDLVEAWSRFVEHTYTIEDLALLLNSIEENDFLQEFDEVSDRVWTEAFDNKPLMTEDRRGIYRMKAAQILAEYQRMQKMQTRQLPLRNRFRKMWYAAAAAILLGLLIPAAYLYMKPEAEQVMVVQYLEESTQRGEIKTVFLPDQTEVTLNAGSRIKYPANFTDDERSVELFGEALFDVTSDPVRPFTVKTENMNIKVVGTVFDVKEYADDLTASVSVASGKVEVILADEKLMVGQNHQVTLYKTTGDSEKKIVDADKYLSWRGGTLYFYRTPIREVINILNRHFPQIDIELDEDEYFNLITGEHDNVRNPENILKGITYTTGLKYKKNGNKYILYK